MDIILHKFNLINNMSQNRLNQLKKINQQNNLLVNASQNCPKLLIKHFLNMNKINELQTEMVFKQNYINMFNHLEENMNQVNKIILLTDQVTEKKDLCSNFNQIISFQENMITQLQKQQ